MQKLKQFLRFDWGAFSAGKSYMFLRKKPWLDNNKRQLGVKYEAVISEDSTNYGENVDTELNLGEKVIFKVAKDIDIPPRAIIEPINAVATVYGDYGNQLSVTAADIRIVGNQGGNPKKEN